MSFLDTILDHKKDELSHRKRVNPIASIVTTPLYRRSTISLSRAICGTSPAIIAELKKASPSKGEIRKDFNVPVLASGYEAGGACAISVLTDERFFSGSLENVDLARANVSLPLLRKDFVIDAYQIHEARAHGADAVLLIVAALAPSQIVELMGEASSVGLETLVEVHSIEETKVALDAGATLIGINNRNLHTFMVDIQTTLTILPHIPATISVISESGIGSADEICRLLKSGVRGFLLGESLMRMADPGEALSGLISSVRRLM